MGGWGDGGIGGGVDKGWVCRGVGGMGNGI